MNSYIGGSQLFYFTTIDNDNMRRTINNGTLTKDFIFSKVSQVTIFSVYSGVSDYVIQHCIDTGNLISSPFRTDEHPSFGFRYNNKGVLKGRDFAGYFWGDCLDAAAYVLSGIVKRNIDINNKADFFFVLRHIVYTFRDIIYGKEKDTNVDVQIAVSLQEIRNRKSVIEIATRPWNKSDKAYWEQFGISLNHLNTHFVYPIEQYYINRYSNPEPKYYYDKKDPCYAYVLGQDKHGIYNIKLYFPKRKKGDVRFITNCNHIEGVLNLERNDYDIVVITKSTKDRLAIENHFYVSNPLRGVEAADLKIGVLNLPHETYRLKQKEYNFIQEKLAANGSIVSLMDNDMTGYREAIWLRDAYDITPILIPKEYDVKDFSELKKEYSNEIVNQLIVDVYNYLTNNSEDNGEDSELTWDTGESDTLPY